MSWAALTSGGKDSILAVQKAIDRRMDVRYLVTMRPENRDSYMFHSSNLDAVASIARVSGIGYIEVRTRGEKEEELTDLKEGLSGLPIEGIIAGAVASAYQFDRVSGIAESLGLDVFTPLWHMDEVALLEEVAARLDAIIVVTAADGLDESLLGSHVNAEFIDRIRSVAAKHRIHIAGEGGEYESLTLNAPFYDYPIAYRGAEIRSAGYRHELVLRGFIP